MRRSRWGARGELPCQRFVSHRDGSYGLGWRRWAYCCVAAGEAPPRRPPRRPWHKHRPRPDHLRRLRVLRLLRRPIRNPKQRPVVHRRRPLAVGCRDRAPREWGQVGARRSPRREVRRPPAVDCRDPARPVWEPVVAAAPAARQRSRQVARVVDCRGREQPAWDREAAHRHRRVARRRLREVCRRRAWQVWDRVAALRNLVRP
jgi:hypothetical protein